MTICVKSIKFSVLPMETRFPFQYGIASMTELPHLIATAEVEIGGELAMGCSSEGLPPKWFTKNPQTKFEDDDLPEMLRVIRKAAGRALEVGQQASFFAFWQELYQCQMDWAKDNQVPPLLANLGTALIERAVLDSLCRHLGKPLGQVIRENLLSIEFGAIHEELSGLDPVDFLPVAPLGKVEVRHTVGLGDPLTSADVAEGEGVDDGLPFTLEENIRAYGLKYFKIKLSGNFERDRDRLQTLARIISNQVKGRATFTLDGNENYRDINSFREHWQELAGVPEIGKFLLEGLIMVEQPLHRDHALSESVREELAGWSSAPPLIIDESDGELSSLPKAFDLGYSGVSHKNCKGIIKGLANAALVSKKQGLLSAEDLANVGPIALLQDLAVVASLGISHVERNGHHYFKGLSMWPEGIRGTTLTNHSDLYHKHEAGFPTLTIDGGSLILNSVVSAPFGVAALPDTSSLQDLK